MESHCIPPSEIPHTPHLFSTFAQDWERVAKYYRHPPTEQGIFAAARDVRNAPGRLRAVVEVLREQNNQFGSDSATMANLERLEAGAVAVVTGQQVGLFTGPAFSFYKAVTALRIARDISKHGMQAVPIFWLATEDHDLAEINHSYWLSRAGLRRLETQAEEAHGVRSVGRIQLGEESVAVVRAAKSLLEGPAADEIAHTLEESYQPEATFGSAFARALARLLAGQGLILLDPLDARLHRQAAPVYRQALEESESLTRELLARSKELDRARYHAQVKVTERATLLFLDVNGHRVPLRRRNSSFVAGSAEFSLAELLEQLESAPENFSANVLLRPVVQDALLPTVAYISGPAETAYFAQAEVAYARLLGRMPAVVPRAGFTLIEPHVARLLRKYNLDLRDLLRGRQHLRSKMEREFLSRALAARFDAGEKTIRKILVGLRRPIGKLDRTLLGALENAERKMLYQFGRLRGKAARAENFRTGVLDAHERQLTDALYPHHGLQERTLCLLPLLARHGTGLLRELLERAGLGAYQHQVLYL